MAGRIVQAGASGPVADAFGRQDQFGGEHVYQGAESLFFWTRWEKRAKKLRGVEGALPQQRFRGDPRPPSVVQKKISEVEIAIDEEPFFAAGNYGDSHFASEAGRLGKWMAGGRGERRAGIEALEE